MSTIEFVLCVLIVVGLFFLGGIAGANRVRNEAVKSGVAEYYIGADNDKLFRWKTSDIKK